VNPYVLLAITIGLVLSHGGAYWQGRTDGGSAVRVEWDAAIIAATAAADEARKKDQAKAQALSKRLQARIATQDQTNREIASQLEIAIGKANTPAACIVTDGVRQSINAALAGESPPAGKLPPASAEAPAARVQ
jgi:hypothetical protein